MTETIKHGHFRIGTVPEPMREEDRDVEIGAFLARRRFADADQIARWAEPHAKGSHAGTKRRLTKLKRNRYLGLPEQKEYWSRCGRNDFVYGNLDKMARRLQKEGLVDQGRLDWSKKTKTVGNDFVEHTVETTELLLTFETTLRDYPGFRLKEKEELFEALPERTQAFDKPWLFKGKPAGFPPKCKDVATPDAVFSVEQTINGEKNEQFFVAEIDTTAMTVVRGAKLFENGLKRAMLDLKEAKGKDAQEAAKKAVDRARDKLLLHSLTTDQSGFLAKFIRYYWAYKQDWHKNHFGWPALRHLITTRNASHRDRMIEALQYVTGGQAPNLFLFTTFAEVRECDDILKLDWLNGAGEPMSIMAKK